MGARALPLHPLIAALAALALLAPGAQAAKPCRPAGFHPVYLVGEGMALQAPDGRVAICDLRTKRVRQVLADGTLAPPGRRGDALRAVRFASSTSITIGLAFKARRQVRIVHIDLPSLRTRRARASRMPAGFFDGQAGTVFEIPGAGVFEFGPDAGVRRGPVIAPSFWSGGLAIGDTGEFDPVVFWLDRNGKVRSSTDFHIGTGAGDAGESDIVAARDGRCARAGYRLIYAQEAARVLRDPATGAVALCDATTGALNDAATGVAVVTGIVTAGHWLVEGERPSRAPNAPTTWAAYDLATGARRVVSQPGDEDAGVTISRRGTVVYGVKRAGAESIETLDAAGTRSVLSTQPNVFSATVALAGTHAYWRDYDEKAHTAQIEAVAARAA